MPPGRFEAALEEQLLPVIEDDINSEHSDVYRACSRLCHFLVLLTSTCTVLWSWGNIMWMPGHEPTTGVMWKVRVLVALGCWAICIYPSLNNVVSDRLAWIALVTSTGFIPLSWIMQLIIAWGSGLFGILVLVLLVIAAALALGCFLSPFLDDRVLIILVTSIGLVVWGASLMWLLFGPPPMVDLVVSKLEMTPTMLLLLAGPFYLLYTLSVVEQDSKSLAHWSFAVYSGPESVVQVQVDGRNQDVNIVKKIVQESPIFSVKTVVDAYTVRKGAQVIIGTTTNLFWRSFKAQREFSLASLIPLAFFLSGVLITAEMEGGRPVEYLRTCDSSKWRPMFPPVADLYVPFLPSQNTSVSWFHEVLPILPGWRAPPQLLLPTLGQVVEADMVLRIRKYYFVPLIGVMVATAAGLCEVLWAMGQGSWAMGQGRNGNDTQLYMESLTKTKEYVFFVFYMVMHIFLYVVVDVALIRGWVNPHTMLDWEIWCVWVAWVCAVQVTCAGLVYLLDLRQHQHPSMLLPGLLMPVMGAELHIMLDHVKVALFKQTAVCVEDREEQIVCLILAYSTLLWIYGHLPFMFHDAVTRRSLVSSHLPVMVAPPPGGNNFVPRGRGEWTGKATNFIADKIANATTPDKIYRAVLADLPLSVLTSVFAFFVGNTPANWFMVIVGLMKVVCIIIVRGLLMRPLLRSCGIGWNSFKQYASGIGQHPLVEASIISEGLFRYCLPKCPAKATDTLGNTVLHQVCSSRDPRPGVIKVLVEDAHYDVHAQNVVKQAPLHVLCDNAAANPEALNMLLTHRADLNVADKRGRTPLLMALDRRADREKEVHEKIIEGMLKAGADPNVGGAVLLAMNSSDVPVVSLLLGHGANAQDYFRQAVMSSQREMIKPMLEAWADANFDGGSSGSPLLWAKDEGCVKLLLEFRADPQVQDCPDLLQSRFRSLFPGCSREDVPN